MWFYGKIDIHQVLFVCLYVVVCFGATVVVCLIYERGMTHIDVCNKKQNM